MLRPPSALQARGPDPLMRAAGALTAGVEGVPIGSASVIKIFGIVAVPACPEAQPTRPPPAMRTADFC